MSLHYDIQLRLGRFKVLLGPLTMHRNKPFVNTLEVECRLEE